MVNLVCKVFIFGIVLYVATSESSPVPEIPEHGITVFNTDIEYELAAKFKEPQHEQNKNSDDFDDIDPMDEDFLTPTKPDRFKRTIAFRPKFVYEQQHQQEMVEAGDRADRRSGRSQGSHHRHNQGHSHVHDDGPAHERTYHHNHGYGL